MYNTIYIGNTVICIVNGVMGIVIKQYVPTASEEQTIIKCVDGRIYHASTSLFKKVNI